MTCITSTDINRSNSLLDNYQYLRGEGFAIQTYNRLDLLSELAVFGSVAG